MDYQTIFQKLNELKIDYLVVGGLAVNLHGVPRMTYDIDLMIHLSSENVRKLVDTLKEWGYRPKIPADPMDLGNEDKRNSWIQEKEMKALNFYSESLPIGEIDLVISSPVPYDDLKKRAVEIEVGGEKIPVISIHDLITVKVNAGRKQDLSDVEHLKMILER
jgi:hypothetical protein